MKPGTIAALVAAVVIGLPIGFLLLLSDEAECGAGGDAPAPSAEAANGIPANYLELYQAAGQQYGIPWNLIAAIGKVETDHGRLKAPGVSSGQNSHGCCAGPMQFHNNYGSGGGTWGAYGVDGNRDGKKDIYDPRDAIPAAGKYLKASGAPGDLHRAIFAYNHAEWYVQKVLAQMRAYGASAPRSATARPSRASAVASRSTVSTPTTATAAAAPAAAPDTGMTGACEDGGGATGTGNGRWKLAPGANRPGASLTPKFTAFLDRMATFYEGEFVVTTGTNHSQFVAGSNRESDHWRGNGADFGMVLNKGTNDGPVGDAISAAAFMAAGVPRDQAVKRGRAGGGDTVVVNGVRIQIIWKVGGSYGNHHDHVHVGMGG